MHKYNTYFTCYLTCYKTCECWTIKTDTLFVQAQVCSKLSSLDTWFNSHLSRCYGPVEQPAVHWKCFWAYTGGKLPAQSIENASEPQLHIQVEQSAQSIKNNFWGIYPFIHQKKQSIDSSTLCLHVHVSILLFTIHPSIHPPSIHSSIRCSIF